MVKTQIVNPHDQEGNLIYGNEIIETNNAAYISIDGDHTVITRFETNNWYKVDGSKDIVEITPKVVTDKIVIAHLILKPEKEIERPQTHGYITCYNGVVEWPLGELESYKVGFTYVFRVEQHSQTKLLAYLESITKDN